MTPDRARVLFIKKKSFRNRVTPKRREYRKRDIQTTYSREIKLR